MDDIKRILEKIKDVFMFREGSYLDNLVVPPTVTAGSIIWGVLLRSAVIILGTTFVVMLLEMRGLWWFSVFIFWFVVVFPAYRQYNKFSDRLVSLKNDTLCGKCKYFVSESQLCSILDEHIGTTTIPCDGENWEANPDIFFN